MCRCNRSVLVLLVLAMNLVAGAINLDELARANSLAMEGRYEAARQILEAEYRRVNQTGLGGPDVATLMSNLGMVYSELGQYVKAAKMYHRSLLMQRKFGTPEVKSALNLADLYLRMEQPRKAEQILKRTLVDPGASDPTLRALILNVFGEVHRHTGEPTKALHYYQQALNTLETAPASQYQGRGAILNNMGLVLRFQGRRLEAVRQFSRAVKAWEEELGPGHPDLVAGYTNLGAAQSDLGGNAEAEVSFQSAISIGKRCLGADHPLTAKAYLYYADLLRKTGRKRAAKALQKDASATLAFHSEENLLGHTVDLSILRRQGSAK